MIQVSTRYVPYIVALLVAIGVPTLLHSADRFDVDECEHYAAELARGSESAPDSTSGPGAVRARFLQTASPDGSWAEGTIPLAEGENLRTVVVRSFDAKLLYHWPDGRMLAGDIGSAHADRRAVELLPTDDGELPVHRAYYDALELTSRHAWITAYVLVYRSQPVVNPYLAQLRGAPAQLVTGRRPMWLFIVFGKVRRDLRESAEDAARAWLVDAWRDYRAACG